jgi:hypothetical protein
MAPPARDIPGIAWRRSLRGFNRALGRLETALADGGEAPLEYPPLLIVGAPRSGSTLLYQLVVERFDVAFLSNLHCRFFGAPSLVERFPGQGLEERSATYRSHHGQTVERAEPSECGQFWYRFFRKFPQHVSLAEADPAQLRRLRASMRALGDAARRPLVFKNLVCSLRLGPIGTVLPEALFVFIRRDPLDNARSLLASRMRSQGDYVRWWSVQPPELERLSALPPYEQVVEQVRAIEAVVEADRAELGPARFFELRYEDVCDDPRGVLDAIAGFAEEHGMHLVPRREVPDRFERPAPPEIDAELDAALVAYLSRTGSP